MAIINKVIVSSRLESGDSIDVSVKAVDKPLSLEDKALLERNITSKILPHVEDTLYFSVRKQSGLSGKNKENWNKLKTINDVNKVVNEIFEVK